MSLITPLNRVLGLGSAQGGTGHWWNQRLTAAALVLLGLWFALSMLGFESFSHAEVVAWVRRPMTSVLLILTAGVALYHSYLGVQVVLEDYVQGHAVKVAALVLSAFAHVFAAVAAVFSVLKVAFGAA